MFKLIKQPKLRHLETGGGLDGHTRFSWAVCVRFSMEDDLSASHFLLGFQHSFIVKQHSSSMHAAQQLCCLRTLSNLVPQR